MHADYGKFVHDLKAYDKAGKEIPVKALTENSWQISGATRLHKIVYNVEDTWESSIDHAVYDMAGTNIEAGKNFVITGLVIFGTVSSTFNWSSLTSFRLRKYWYLF